MENKEIIPIQIDLGIKRKKQLNEFFLTAFGAAVKSILGAMFGGDSLPVNIRGTKGEVSAFARTIGKEKRYMDSFQRHGLSDPRTLKDKVKLSQSVKKFEKETGIPWPFK